MGTLGTRRTAQKALLTQTNTELIDFKVFDKDGNFKDTEEKNVLLSSPTILNQIDKSLTVEYLPPIKKVIREVKLKKINIVNNDPFLHYGGYRYNFFFNSLSRALVEVNDKSLSGDRLIKGLYAETDSGSINVTSAQTAIENDGTNTEVRVGNKYKIGFSFYIENTVTGTDLDYYFAITVKLVAGSSTFFYDFKKNEFDSASSAATKHFKVFKETNSDVWNNVSVELNTLEEVDEQSAQITVSISQPQYRNSTAFGGHQNYYIDNFFIDQIFDNSEKFIVERVSSSTKTITGVRKDTDLILSNDLGSSLFDGGFDGNFKRLVDSTVLKKLDEHITQETLNDFRDYMKRYEGTFFNNNTDPIPIALHNKIWFNFPNNVFTEDVSAYIDSMSFNVKRNTYDISMHIPNQDDDFASLYSIKYE